MTLHQLKVFLTIVKLNGVAQAAKALHISQPSVSGVVQDLQNELGVKLFERLGNKRQLTEAGKRVLQRAETVLANAEAIKDDLDDFKGLKKGKLSVGGCGTAGTAFLPLVVQTFKNQCPMIDVTLRILNSDELEKKLLGGELEVAIIARVPQSPLVVYEPYWEEEVVVIAPPRHPLTKKRYVPLKLVAQETLIVHERGNGVRDLAEAKFTEAGLPFKVGLEVYVRGGARDAIKMAVASGLGIGFMSKCHVLPDVTAGRVKLLRCRIST